MLQSVIIRVNPWMKLRKLKKRPNSELLRDIASKKQQDIKTRENSLKRKMINEK